MSADDNNGVKKLSACKELLSYTVLAFRINNKNICQDTHLFKSKHVSCKKNKISIMHLMFYQSVTSKLSYFVSCLHGRKS